MCAAWTEMEGAMAIDEIASKRMSIGYYVLAGRMSSRLVGNNMIRTQISLDEHEYDIAKREARLLGISVAEFVRRAVREALPPHGQGPWMRYAGLVETGNPRSNQPVDEIVYGRRGCVLR